MKLLLVISLLIAISSSCHYSCATNTSCSTQDYFSCTACGINRGNNGVPIGGMCYCSDDSDQDENGICQNSKSFNALSKALIATFIALSLLLALMAVIIKGNKYFLYKTIEDVQEISLIVFINLYFPQQFDIFLTHLYGFNISSYTFQNIASGTLYYIMPDSTIISKDGQNIMGKYILLHKSANFFANQFTWLIVFFSIFVTAIIVRAIRNHLKKKKIFQIIKTQIEGPSNVTEMNDNLSNAEGQWVQVKRQQKDQGYTFYWFINKVYNITWFNFLIIFFYFSIIEMNINIFTQISNLTFSSNFATAGAFFSALFLGIQIVILILLFLKAKQEMIKPQWMRDYSYTPTIYLIRTNYKTITKYFWFISCIKKMLIALMLTSMYKQPISAIVGVTVVHTVYISFAIYCQPFQRKYIRAHFYITESAKMFLFLSLINFTTQYANFVSLIDLTTILYSNLAFIFGMHLFFLLISICMEWQVYKYFFTKKFCTDNTQIKRKVGYRCEQKVFLYIKQ